MGATTNRMRDVSKPGMATGDSISVNTDYDPTYYRPTVKRHGS